MPDTGAPWNIPYVESTDLVSDWPADSLALANAIDAGLDAALLPGIGSNVVQTVKTDTFTTTSSSFVDVTSFSVTITPSSASSKILVIAYMNISGALDQAVHTQLLRGSSVILRGDASGSSVRSTFGSWNASQFLMLSSAAVYLDSPNTTSATTYKIQMSSSSGTASFNRSSQAQSGTKDSRPASTITAIEVAA